MKLRHTRWVRVSFPGVIKDTLGHKLTQLYLTKTSCGLSVNVQFMLPQTALQTFPKLSIVFVTFGVVSDVWCTGSLHAGQLTNSDARTH